MGHRESHSSRNKYNFIPRRKIPIITGEIYHIIIRAIDENLIFADTNDYFRGIFSIYEFNNVKPIEIWRRRRERLAEKKKEKLWDSRCPTILMEDERDRFVDVLSFCFMPNHIHLLVKQVKDNGISRFMQKVGIGLSKYFNQKHQRKGHVFQDTFKSVHIEDDKQLMTVLDYIFANPISLIESGYKENGIINHSVDEVMKFLENYKWSSYKDYIGIKNFPSVIKKDFVLEFMGGEKGIKNILKGWIEQKKYIGKNLEKYSNIILE